MTWGFLHARRTRLIVGAVVGVALAALIVLAAFPWGMLRGPVESRLRDRFGPGVTIGTVERVDHFGFHPVIAVRDVRIPQPGWAGKGDFVRLREARATLSTWAILTGKARPSDIRLRGLALALIRAKDGRTNWGGDKDAKGGGAPDLGRLDIADSVVGYDDAKQDRHVRASLSSGDQGLRVAGRGTVRGAPVAVTLSGPRVDRTDRAWPFTAAITGDALSMKATGQMARPLDTGHMTLDLTARASDLKYIDAIIEAGLFRTQPVALTAHVRHDDPRWIVTDLDGTIGRTDLAGSLTVDKRDGRTKLDGDIRSRQLDFDDLASDEGIAEAQALKRAIGPRLVPNTRVDIGKIDKTDGVIRFKAGPIVSRAGPSGVLAIAGTLTLDHQLLSLTPMHARLRQGVVTGAVTVDQRGGRKAPLVTIDVRLDQASVRDLAGDGGDFTGRVAARARLRGVGETIRAAVGHSDGTIGFVARDGTLPKKYAAALGFDAGRALTTGDAARAGLRCVVLRLDMKDGRGTASPLIVDTTESKLHGTGTVTFPAETMALTLTGAPKHGSVLRLPGAASLGGTLSQPDLTVPREVKSAGNIFKAIGRAISGHQGPTATDADCAGLAARALR
jgi:uncharacterized protein involved in outer membrane biogenesis